MTHILIVFLILSSLAISTEASNYKHRELSKYKKTIYDQLKKLVESNNMKGQIILKNPGNFLFLFLKYFTIIIYTLKY